MQAADTATVASDSEQSSVDEVNAWFIDQDGSIPQLLEFDDMSHTIATRKTQEQDQADKRYYATDSGRNFCRVRDCLFDHLLAQLDKSISAKPRPGSNASTRPDKVRLGRARGILEDIKRSGVCVADTTVGK